jgi:hypothetical protein
MKAIIFVTLYLVLSAAIIYGMWRLVRWANWSFDYGDRVEQVIQDKVKPECLIQ